MSDTQKFSPDGPICPHCGWLCTPDEAFYYNETGYDLECGECEKKFNVQPNCRWTWFTRPVEESVKL